MTLPFVVETYRAAVPALAPEDAAQTIEAAVGRARAKHPDFDRFLPGIEFLSQHVFCAFGAIPLDDYLETLYCAVKHGDFTRSWRQQFKPNARSTEPSSDPS